MAFVNMLIISVISLILLESSATSHENDGDTCAVKANSKGITLTTACLQVFAERKGYSFEVTKFCKGDPRCSGTKGCENVTFSVNLNRFNTQKIVMESEYLNLPSSSEMVSSTTVDSLETIIGETMVPQLETLKSATTETQLEITTVESSSGMADITTEAQRETTTETKILETTPNAITTMLADVSTENAGLSFGLPGKNISWSL